MEFRRQHCFRCDFQFRKPRSCLVSVVYSVLVFYILLLSWGRRNEDSAIASHFLSSVPSCFPVLSSIHVLVHNSSTCPHTHVPDIIVHIHGQILFHDDEAVVEDLSSFLGRESARCASCDIQQRPLRKAFVPGVASFATPPLIL